jgi:hypothetical protein
VPSEPKRKNVITALILLGVAVGFYVAFFVVMS